MTQTMKLLKYTNGLLKYTVEKIVQNKGNLRKTSGHTSVYKGVSWCTARGLWVAMLAKNRKNKYLGAFSSEEEAANAYATAAKIYFGEFFNTGRVA